MKKDYYSKQLNQLLIQIVDYYKSYGVTANAVKVGGRVRPLPEIRAVFIVIGIIKFVPRFNSIVEVCSFVGLDHSNYKHAQRFVNEMYETDKNFRKLFDKIKSELLPDMTTANYFIMEDIH